MNKPLAFLPNTVGFAFNGNTKDGGKLACVVKADEQGLHYVADEKGNRVFSLLASWSK